MQMLQRNFEQCPPYQYACWEVVLDYVIEMTVPHVLLSNGGQGARSFFSAALVLLQHAQIFRL